MEVASTAPLGLKVLAYRNLTRGGWSLKALEGPARGRVVARVAACALEGCAPHFKRSDLARMRRERKRYVCAGIIGTVCEIGAGACARPAQRVTFNPWTDDAFTLKATGQPIAGAAGFTFTATAEAFAHAPEIAP